MINPPLGQTVGNAEGCGNELVLGDSTEIDVRFGSKADMAAIPNDVRFTPKSGHWQTTVGCPVCAKSRHSRLLPLRAGAA